MCLTNQLECCRAYTQSSGSFWCPCGYLNCYWYIMPMYNILPSSPFFFSTFENWLSMKNLNEKKLRVKDDACWLEKLLISYTWYLPSNYVICSIWKALVPLYAPVMALSLSTYTKSEVIGAYLVDGMLK